MHYRLQDLMKLIIPGMYIEALVFGWYIFTNNDTVEIEKLKDVSSIILFMIPFVGFVIGYYVECTMALVKRLYYLTGLRVPSNNILSGKSKLYSQTSSDKIIEKYERLTNKKIRKIKNKRVLTNSEANDIFQEAKQNINRDVVEPFRITKVLARNLFGAQFLVTLIYACVTDCFYTDITFYFLLFILNCFLLYWHHHSHVYVKYVFAEYAKSLK